MREEQVVVYVPKCKKNYSSYAGEIIPEVLNNINRNFKSGKPHEKDLTDISEFTLSDGKVYLSPLIDCYDGLPITWIIGKSPNLILTNTMIEQAYEIVGNKSILIHSDKGFHYRIDFWTSEMNQYGYCTFNE